MLDIKFIRENVEFVKERLAARGTDYSELVDRAVELDSARRSLISDTEEQKARQNAKNKEIPALKKAGEDVTAVFEELKTIARRIKEDDARLAETEKELEDVLLSIPNIPNARVPVGKDDSENLEIRRWGEPTSFDFEAKPHWDIGRDLGILDPETAAKVSGTRFHFYKGAPLLNNTLYYLAERALAAHTDVLITINEEDHARARRLKLKPGGSVWLIPGVGLDMAHFTVMGPHERLRCRRSLLCSAA